VVTWGWRKKKRKLREPLLGKKAALSRQEEGLGRVDFFV